jgi:hypothetical protein
MYKLSNISKKRLQGVDAKLVQLVELALSVSPVDFGIAWMGGVRTKEEQKSLYNKGVTTKDGYKNRSKHQDGKAIDFLPYVNGQVNQDEKYYLIVIGVMFAAASQLGINIRSGANWDMDGEFITDQNFKDLPHIELI